MVVVFSAQRKGLEKNRKIMYNNNICAGVMELVDVTDSKSVGGNIVRVRVPPPAPKQKGTT
jgi:hypothetical protein